MTKLVATAVLAAAFSWQPTPARLGVSAKEFHLVLSRPSVKSGRGTRTYRIPGTKPGRRSTLEISLLPGRYRLWCSVADHRALGMQTVLRVRR